MSDRTLFAIPANWREVFGRQFPMATEAHLDALAVLIGTDRFITDDGRATPDLTAWVAVVLGLRPDDGAGPLPVAPPPNPKPLPALEQRVW